MKGKYIYILCTFNSTYTWATPFEKYKDAIDHMNTEICDLTKRFFSATRKDAKVRIYTNNASVTSSDGTEYQFIIYRKKIR